MLRALIIILLCLVPVSALAAGSAELLGEYPAGKPVAIDVDDEGNIFAAQSDGTIRVLDWQGGPLAVWECRDGNGRNLLKSPSGLSYFKGRVFVSDESLNEVVVFDSSGKHLDSFGGRGSGRKEFKGPTGIHVSGGVVFVSDSGNDRIQLFGPNGVYIGQRGLWPYEDFRRTAEPRDVGVDSFGNYYVINGEKNIVQAFSPGNGHLLNFVGLNEPNAIAAAFDGMYIADAKDYKVYKFDYRGNRLFSFGSKGKGGSEFLEISDIAAGVRGKIYVSDSKKGTIQVFAASDGASSVVALEAKPPSHAVWKSETGLVSDYLHWDGNALYSIDRDRRAIDVVKDGSVVRSIQVADFTPEAVAVDPNGFLWVVDRGNDRLVKLDGNGKFMLSVGSSGSEGGYLKDPSDIVITSLGFIYVSDTGNRRIQSFSADGVFLGVLEEKKSELFQRPTEMALSPDGKLFVLDEKMEAVFVFSANGKYQYSFGGRGFSGGKFNGPKDISASGSVVFVLDAGNGRVQILDHRGGYLSDFGARGRGKGDFSNPASIEVINDNTIYLSDLGEKKVQTLGVVRVPDPPQTVSSEGGMRAASLKWDASIAGDRASYRVYRSESETYGFEQVAAVDEPAFDDRQIEPGKYYYYRVSTVGGGGEESNKSISVKIKSSKYSVMPPSGLSASATIDSVDLYWRAVNDEALKHYIVYRKHRGVFEEIATVASEAFSDKLLQPDTTYEYMISAVSSDLVESKGGSVKVRTLSDVVPVEVELIDMKDLFSNTYYIYESQGVGKIRVTNNMAQPVSGVKLTFTLRNYSDEPFERVLEELQPEESVDVDVTLRFNRRVFNVQEDTPVQTEVRVSYTKDDELREIAKHHSMKLYAMNRLRWSERERIATFVTPSDPVVSDFARRVVNQYGDGKERAPLIFSRAIFDAIGVLGVAYKPDAKIPYAVSSTNRDFVDTSQYPRETLQRKAGDNDDLVSLYASALESAGIETMLIDYPGYLLLMFSSGVLSGPDDNGRLFDGMAISHDGVLWIPVDVTMIGSSFLDAWKSGYAKYLENKVGVRIVDVWEAWKKYRPVSLGNTDWRPEIVQRTAIEGMFAGEFEQLQKVRINNRTRNFAERLSADPSDVDAALKLGIIYNEYGMKDEAMKIFRDALAKAPKSAALRNSIGNLHFQDGNYTDAASEYDAASKLDPDDAFILINLTRCYLKMNMKGQAKESFVRAFKLNREVFKIYKTMSAELM